METVSISCDVQRQTSRPRSSVDRAKQATRSLLAFLEIVFLPLEANESSSDYRSQCRRAVKLYAAFLGYPAMLADLTADQVNRFAQWLNENASDRQPRMIRKRLRSIWRYAATIGVADSIDEHSRTKTVKTCREAVVIEPVMTPGTVSHFFETVYLPQRLVGASKIGIENYRTKIRQFEKFLGRPVLINELNDTLVASFLNDRVDAGLRKVTVNVCRAHILAIWRLAVELGQVVERPSIKKLRATHDEPDSWTEDEFRSILKHCDRLATQPPLGGLPADAVMRAVLLLAYWTGLRRGTLWKLKWNNIDVEQRWLSVPGELMKSGRGKKLRFGTDAAEALRAIQVAEAASVLPKLDWHRFYTDFDLVLAAAGVPPSTRVRMTKLHKVRRTTATLLAMREGIGAASTLLGHSSEQMTRRYVDPSKLPGNDMTNVLPNLSNKNEGGAA